MAGHGQHRPSPAARLRPTGQRGPTLALKASSRFPVVRKKGHLPIPSTQRPIPCFYLTTGRGWSQQGPGTRTQSLLQSRSDPVHEDEFLFPAINADGKGCCARSEGSCSPSVNCPISSLVVKWGLVGSRNCTPGVCGTSRLVRGSLPATTNCQYPI